MNKVAAVIVAAGKGTRMGGEKAKQFLPILGKPILVHCLEVFEKCNFIEEVVLVAGENDLEECHQLTDCYQLKKVSHIVAGGPTRQHSVYNGLMALSENTDIVLIHDGARPFVTLPILETTVEAAKRSGSGVAGVPVKDTIKEVDEQGNAVRTLDRDILWSVQTPQTFQYRLILKAYQEAWEKEIIGTDDATLVERMGYPVKMVMGSYDNIKITTPHDLVIGEAILRSRSINGETKECLKPCG